MYFLNLRVKGLIRDVSSVQPKQFCWRSLIGNTKENTGIVYCLELDNGPFEREMLEQFDWKIEDTITSVVIQRQTSRFNASIPK